jgi:tape measure domain-containing protein
MAGYVTNLVKTDKNLFGDLDTATEFAGLTTKVLKTTSRTDTELASAQTTLNKVFEDGIMSADTFKTMLKSYPEIINTMSEGLGVTTEQLSYMASAGKLTSSTLVTAFSNASETINSDFEEVDYTISDAMTNIRNSWGLFITDVWKGSGITNGVGKMMVRAFNSLLDLLKKLQPFIERIIRFTLSGVQKAMDLISRVTSFLGRLVNKVGGVENALKLLSVAAGMIWLMLNASKIEKFLSKVKKALAAINLKVLSIIAVVLVLFLLVDDFINFMKGNDSVLGECFKKAGIDADEMRQKIINTWENLKKFFAGIWNSIKKICEPIIKAISDRIKNVFGDDIFAGLGNGIAGVIGMFEKISAALANNTRLQDALGKIITIIAAVITAVKVGIPVVNGVLTTIKAVKTAISAVGAAMSFLTSPVGLVIAGIVALIAICVALYKNWDTVKALAIKVWTAIYNFFQSIFSAIAGFFKSVWNGISSFFVGLWDGIYNTVASVVVNIAAVISAVLATIKAIWEAIWNGISTFFSTIWNGISGFVSNVWNNIVSGVSGFVSNIYNNIVDGLTKAIDWIKGLPAQALQWGADIINGIANGIKGAVSKVTDAVSGVADKIKSFLHFSAPDEGPLKDYQDWMPDMMSGLTKGISENDGSLIDSVKNVAADISTLMQGASASVATAANGAVTNNSNTTNVTQNNTFNNSYSGSDTQTQQNVSKGMNKSAQDATAYMAKGLAYAR